MSSRTSGTKGTGALPFSSSAQFTLLNHGCLKISLMPALPHPSRPRESRFSSRRMRSLASLEMLPSNDRLACKRIRHVAACQHMGLGLRLGLGFSPSSHLSPAAPRRVRSMLHEVSHSEQERSRDPSWPSCVSPHRLQAYEQCSTEPHVSVQLCTTRSETTTRTERMFLQMAASLLAVKGGQPKIIS